MKWGRYATEEWHWAARADGPDGEPVDSALDRAPGITVTLRMSRNAVLVEGSLVRENSGQNERLSGPIEFRIVLEGAPMNDAELSESGRLERLPPLISSYGARMRTDDDPMTRPSVRGIPTTAWHASASGFCSERRGKKAAMPEFAASLSSRKVEAIWGGNEDE